MHYDRDAPSAHPDPLLDFDEDGILEWDRPVGQAALAAAGAKAAVAGAAEGAEATHHAGPADPPAA